MNPVRLLPKEMLRADASVPAHQQAHPSAAQIQPDSGTPTAPHAAFGHFTIPRGTDHFSTLTPSYYRRQTLPRAEPAPQNERAVLAAKGALSALSPSAAVQLGHMAFNRQVTLYNNLA